MSCPDPAAPEKADAPAGDTGCAANALFHDLTRWREQLARSLARNNLPSGASGIARATKPDPHLSPLPADGGGPRALLRKAPCRRFADHPDRYGQLLEVTAPLSLLFEDEG